LGCRLLHDAVSRDVLAIANFFVLRRQAGTDSLNLHVFLITIFRPFAAPGKCRPVRTAPPHPSRYATDNNTGTVTSSDENEVDELHASYETNLSVVN